MVSPGTTQNCLPPDRMIAYIGYAHDSIPVGTGANLREYFRGLPPANPQEPNGRSKTPAQRDAVGIPEVAEGHEGVVHAEAIQLKSQSESDAAQAA